MKWLLIGGVLVGAGVFVVAVANNSSPSQHAGSYPAFGMPLYGGANGSGGPGGYGMAYYGGYPGAGAGYWKPSMLEGKGGQGTS